MKPASRHTWYDQHLRDPIAAAFYKSAAWLRARGIKLRNDPICERCRVVFAEHVHHIIPLAECVSLEQKLDQKNLMSVCQSCHSIIEGEIRRSKSTR